MMHSIRSRISGLRKVAPGGLALLGSVLVWPVSGSRADLRIESRIEVRTSASCDSLVALTFLRGPWLRREVRGTGALSNLFGKNVQIINRQTGEALTLYPEEKRYARDSLGPRACRPEAIVDMRFLGSVQTSATVNVALPDTVLALLGTLARPVQIDVRPLAAAREGTRIRIWLTTDYGPLFGAGYADDLFCGDESSDVRDRAALSAAWREQFRLADADAKLMEMGMVGYPVKVESLYGPDSALLSSTTIQTTRVDRGRLGDALFVPPPGFREIADDSGVDLYDSAAAAPGGKP